MDGYRIGVLIPYNGNSGSDHMRDLRADSLQEAADIAFARQIYDGEKHLTKLAKSGYESVIKRENIRVVAYCIFDEAGNHKEYLDITSLSDKNPNGSRVQHPSRLKDSELKHLLVKDEKINKSGIINPSQLEKMTFLI